MSLGSSLAGSFLHLHAARSIDAIGAASRERAHRHRALQRIDMFQKPDIADLRTAAHMLGMNPSDEYLVAVEQIITPLANAYATLDTTPDELPAIKYPRGQFYRPAPEENTYGAWYVKTSIKGKPTGKLAGRRIALKDNVCGSSPRTRPI
jgi:hypothetical protein